MTRRKGKRLFVNEWTDAILVADLSTAAVAVAFAMSKRADFETGEKCFVSARVIGLYTRLSRSAVHRARDELEELGFIEWDKRRIFTGQAKQYTLTIPLDFPTIEDTHTGVHTEPLTSGTGVQKQRKRGSETAKEGFSQNPHQVVPGTTNASGEKRSASLRVSGSREAVVDDVVKHIHVAVSGRSCCTKSAAHRGVHQSAPDWAEIAAELLLTLFDVTSELDEDTSPPEVVAHVDGVVITGLQVRGGVRFHVIVPGVDTWQAVTEWIRERREVFKTAGLGKTQDGGVLVEPGKAMEWLPVVVAEAAAQSSRPVTAPAARKAEPVDPVADLSTDEPAAAS